MQFSNWLIRFKDEVCILWLALCWRYCINKITIWNLCHTHMCILQIILEWSVWNMTRVLLKKFGLAQMFGLHMKYPHLLLVHLIYFFVQCLMHIHYIWIFTKFKLFTSIYPCIHIFPMPMGNVHGAYISQKKCGMENSWMS
jgi:hypothetical protein